MENVNNVSIKSICVVCGNEYSVYHKSRQQYCSTNCRVKGNRDKNKKQFAFLSDEYKKPKIERSVTKIETPQWIFLSEKLNKHKVIKVELEERRKIANKELYNLTSKNKEKIIGTLFGLGIGVIGGYVLSNSKDSMKELAIKIPVGAIISVLAVIGGSLGYAVGSIIGNFKNKKTLEKIALLNQEVSQIDNSIRLELMNIEDLNNQLEYTHRYSSVVENVKKIVTQSPD